MTDSLQPHRLQHVIHYLPEFVQAHVVESVMPSNHLILCRPLLVLPSAFPSIREYNISRCTSDHQV